MSRSKKREVDEIQELKRQIKDQAAIIKSLERKLRQLNEPPVKKELKKKSEPVISPNACPVCKVGKLKKVELGIRTMISCSDCNHRTVTKKN